MLVAILTVGSTATAFAGQDEPEGICQEDGRLNQIITFKSQTVMKKLLTMVAMLAVALTMQAQTKFHDVEANDAKGPVKCIKSNRMNQEVVINFSQDGKMSQEGLTNAKYDANGYLQSATIEAMGNKVDITFKWENGRFVGQKMNVMGQDMEITRTFNEDGTSASDIINAGGQKMESPYSDYKFDSHGNWISRKGQMMGQTIEQTRTIEYYE